MKLKFAPCLILIQFLFLLTPPAFAQESNWYKGNLHTHTYWSDGDEFPEMVLDWYRKNDYQFVAISDHNILPEGEKWKTIPKDSSYQKAFQNYLNKYGEDWVHYKEDNEGIHVKLKTYQEFSDLFEKKGSFMIFKAEEVTSYLEGKAVHMGAINIKHLVEPQNGNSIAELIQNNLDAIKSQEDSIGRPVLQHLNHPNFTYAITAEDIIKLNGERFFEVFNGHPHVNNYGDSVHNSTEEMWDRVNIAYANNNKPLLFGIATDDSHNYHKFGQKYSNAGRGWVTVRADTLSRTAIINNLESGDFYASTGVELEALKMKRDKIKFQIKAEEGVSYTTQIIGVYKNSFKPEIIANLEGADIRFEIPDDLLFLRAKIISDKPKKNPYKKGDVEVAWLQPFIPDN
ncbi:PHP domain-containing protein [Salegentibacter chungangensis]|uniref:PHP domain-containing protein n=1 Tax=Salegentibacter chungangensis TaxID=1335724 RepID=A0ABW3NPX3_9FLAO